MKRLFIIGLGVAVVILLYVTRQTGAIDIPHAPTAIPAIQCSNCHVTHKASGPSLTNDASNSNLCQSCHSSSGLADNKPLDNITQADPWATTGGTGISHRWDAAMPQQNSPDNAYGLRWTTALTNSDIKRQLSTKFGDVVVCSVCHKVHSQSNIPWDPYGGPYTGKKGSDSGVTDVDGTTTTLTDTTKATYWTPDNVWTTFYVRMISGTGDNIGQIRRISGNSGTDITVSSPWSTITHTGDGYEIIGRHSQRIANNTNQMCEDCHYYRSAAWTTNVRTYTGYYQSHPVGKIFTNDTGRDVSDSTQFNDIPLEPSAAGWTTQSGSRYEIDIDGNATNNIILDSSKKTLCMSCHGIHYTDSDSSTLDRP